MYLYTYIYIHIYIQKHTCICTYMYNLIRDSMPVYTYIYTYIYIYICTLEYTHINMHIYSTCFHTFGSNFRIRDMVIKRDPFFKVPAFCISIHTFINLQDRHNHEMQYFFSSTGVVYINLHFHEQ